MGLEPVDVLWGTGNNFMLASLAAVDTRVIGVSGGANLQP